MINLYHNPDLSKNVLTYNNQLNIKINKSIMTFTLIYTDENNEEQTDVKELELSNYFSWIFMQNTKSEYVVREPGKSYENHNAIFPIIKLTHPYRSSYTFIHNLIKGDVLLQVDTGIITDTYKEISIRLTGIPKEHCIIEADEEVSEINTMTKSEALTKVHPKYILWPNYGIKINDTLYKYRKTTQTPVISDNMNIPVSAGNKEYLDIDIIKHDSHFENTLARDVDVEDLELTCSCGLINATRVYLDKGKATIRLYPFGYRGKFKLKIGWRWWPGLNEYELLLTD